MGSGSTRRRDTQRSTAFPLNRGNLRKGLHGWWLGNPLVVCPTDASAASHALMLAREGAAEGTCVVAADATTHDGMAGVSVELALIMPAAVPDPLVERVAAIALWEVLSEAGAGDGLHPTTLLQGTSGAGAVRIEHAERHRLLIARASIPGASPLPEQIITATLRRLNLRYMALGGSGPDMAGA